ncbi:helix-turn-helix domain-containing protein [Antarcticimicrobium sediminis]|uniref:Helix-turn-helix domain-containing protein n=1 Tax=Antarcticimicrobium sediminis TaxID=2546227 RepID=A0A4R5F0F3_9RHOB|nr:helix-turn-helix domain-containing protein [Antarcticimicrobium sediminis]TDE40945.1 helix-turn-helix domain-containing protein [Antarcticimicrobium sediminis]
MTELVRPPAHIAPYVRVLGQDGALAFLLELGGAELYIAKSPKGRSRLVQVVGQDKAEALARVADELPSRIPTAKPWIARVLKAKGLPVAEIARKLHTTDVTVRKYLAGQSAIAQPDPRQPNLPLD